MILRTHAFLQDIDNTPYRQALGYCLYRELCLQVITKAAFWMFACIFRMHRLERKERMKGRENKKAGNGKRSLFVLVHTARFTSNASISQRWETKVIYVERKERKRTELGSILSLLQVCFHGAVKGGVSDVLWLLHTWLLVGKWLFYICGLCALTFPVSVWLFSLLLVLHRKRKDALTRWKKWFEAVQREKKRATVSHVQRKKERDVGRSRCWIV